MTRKLETFARFSQPLSQQGIVLFVALVMLFIMALIGVAGLTLSTKEERLSANFIDNNIAFQAAEAALIAGETEAIRLADQNVTLAEYFNGSSGRFNTEAMPGGNAPWRVEANWNSAEGVPFDSPVASDPRYMLEYMAPIPIATNPSVTPGGYGEFGVESVDMMLIRVTARGIGTNSETTEMLQSLVRVRSIN